MSFGVDFTRPLAGDGTRGGGRSDAAIRSRLRDTRIVEVNAVNRALREAAAASSTRASTALRYSEQLLGTAADVAQFGAHQYDAVR